MSGLRAGTSDIAPLTWVRLYLRFVNEFNDHLARMQDIAARARDFRTDEGSNSKEFSRTVVEDLGALAEALSELIRRTRT